MKDERILVLKTGINKPSCDCLMLEGCTVDDSCACCSVGIPCSQAIEKMAKAIYSEIEKETKTIKSKYTFSSKKFAEAALKALLEEE